MVTKRSPEQIENQIKRSFYKPLYHLDGESQIILLDETTGELLLEKNLSVFNLSVYTYLKAHTSPRIANIRDFWLNEDGTLTVVEQYVNGQTLEACLPDLSDAAKRQVLFDVCDALIFLHAAQTAIIHRDIKPANVMVTPDGRGVLIDFDASKTENAFETRDTVLLGTEGIAAPEQYGFGASDVRTDVYGVGMLIKKLFPGNRFYEKIAAKATKLDPKNRYQTVKALKRALGKKAEKDRSSKKPMLKVIVALPLYFFFILVGCLCDFDTAHSVQQLTFDRAGIIIIFCVIFEIIFTWFPFTRRLPWRNEVMRSKRIFATILWVIVIGFAALFLLVILDTVLF